MKVYEKFPHRIPMAALELYNIDESISKNSLKLQCTYSALANIMYNLCRKGFMRRKAVYGRESRFAFTEKGQQLRQFLLQVYFIYEDKDGDMNDYRKRSA